MFALPNALLSQPVVEEAELPECRAVDPLSGAVCTRRHKDGAHRDDDPRGGCQTTISWGRP